MLYEKSDVLPESVKQVLPIHGQEIYLTALIMPVMSIRNQAV